MGYCRWSGMFSEVYYTILSSRNNLAGIELDKVTEPRYICEKPCSYCLCSLCLVCTPHISTHVHLYTPCAYLVCYSQVCFISCVNMCMWKTKNVNRLSFKWLDGSQMWFCLHWQYNNPLLKEPTVAYVIQFIAQRWFCHILAVK